MLNSRPLRLVLRTALAVLLAVATGACAQSNQQNPKPLPLKPDLPGLATNHRLILKDGTYQIVRKYEIVGDRVRYISVERGGDWEELPVDLVDWDATRKWERDHANQPEEEPSPAMKEAEDIDKEEAAERDEQKARMPEVAKGLELPDEDGVFVLDTFEGTPELVELLPVDLTINAKTKHGLSTLNPLAGAKASLELDGAHAKVHLHVNDPAIYLSLNARDDAEKVLSHAMTVDTGGAKEVANRKHGAHSADLGIRHCAGGRAQGGAHRGRHPHEPYRHGDPGRGCDSRQGGGADRQALAQDHAGTAAGHRRVRAGGDHLRFRHQPVGMGFSRRPARWGTIRGRWGRF